MRTNPFFSACALLSILGAVSCDHPDTIDGLLGHDGHGSGGSGGSQPGGGATEVGEGQSCGGFVLHPPQCSAGLVCLPQPGRCVSPDLPGVCARIPQACTTEYAPVCGCDGKTYGNDCQRLAAQVGLDHKGECQPASGGQGATCGGLAGLRCNKGLFCELPAHSCQVADATGTCQPIPEICNALAHAVCGCDGKTYGNDCERQAAGVSLDHDGACASGMPPGRGEGSTCGGIAGLQCDEGLVCDFPPGMCKTADLAGTCRKPPEVCPDIFMPVCGCDGKTYPNECHRSRTGVPKAHDGACP